MSYFSNLGLSSSGTGYAGGWRKGDVADSPQELHILCTGKIEQGGEVDWDISPLAADDGELQRIIDEAADTEAYEEDMLDREFWSQGGW